MTISLVAVFIPVLFMGGIVGRLLHEFSVTIAVAILISGFVSLSLTPMLGSRFLRYSHTGHHGRLYGAFETRLPWPGVRLRVHAERRAAPSVRHADGRAAAAGGTVYLFFDHADRLHSQPGQRLLFRHRAGRPGYFVRSMAKHLRAVATSCSTIRTCRAPALS